MSGVRSSSCSAVSRARLLDFSQRKLVATQHEGAVVQLSLDPVEHRYLLAGAADATAAVYDICATQIEATGTESCAPVLKIARNNSHCHKYSITSVAWYPIDSGLFITGSLDNEVKVRGFLANPANLDLGLAPSELDQLAGVGHKYCASSMHIFP